SVGGSYAADARGAQVVAGIAGAGAGCRVVGQTRVEAGAYWGAVALEAERVLERRQAHEHELALRRIAHGADAPDLALQGAERGADLDTEIVHEPTPDAELVDAVRHDDGRQEGQPMLARLLAEDREPQRSEAGTQRVAMQTMAREARGETFLVHSPERLAQPVHHRGRRRVVVEAGRAPVVGELTQIEIVAAHLGTAPADDCFGPRVIRDRSQSRRAAQALLSPRGRDVDVPAV